MALSLMIRKIGINVTMRLPTTASTRCLCSKSDTVAFNEEILKILVCPLTKKSLRYNRETNELISDSAGVAYPVRNGIPNLVPQDGRVLNETSDKKQS